jgi:hypothetical protein
MTKKYRLIVIIILVTILFGILFSSYYFKPINTSYPTKKDPIVETKPLPPVVETKPPSVVEEAQKMIAQEPHNRKIDQARILLKKKADLIKELQKVDKQLKDLEDGKEIDEIASYTITLPSTGVWSNTK